MEDHDNSPSTSLSMTVGEQLLAAREAQGLSRADIAAQTRVAERHLISIEENRFAELAAPTYAIGFSRAYARAVGLSETDIAERVRRVLASQPHVRPTPLPSFEPGDPARVPPSRIAWFAGLLAVVVVGLLVFYWSNFLSPEGQLPDIVPDATQSAPAPTAVPSAAAPQAAANGPVMLTATAPQVWVKVTDAAGKQLFQKELGQGESYLVPADAQGPQLRTARPDQLQITIGGRAIPKLGDKPEVISGVLLTPAALVARTGAPGAAPPAATTPGAPVSATPRPATQRTDVPPVPKMDDLLNGNEAPPRAAQDNRVSTAQQ